MILNRIVGRVLTLGASSNALLVFGPFEAGDLIKGLVLYFDNAAPSAGDTLAVDIAVLSSQPATAAIALLGRLLTSGSPLLPVAVRKAELPLSWIASEAERWLAVVVTESAGDNTTGSVWVDVWPLDEIVSASVR